MAYGVMALAGEKRVLFPLAPAEGETVLGYALRVVDWNHLGALGGALTALGLEGVVQADRLADRIGPLQVVAGAFGIDLPTVCRLWGAETTVAGRRRLGGVWLRAHMISSSCRKLPPSLLPGQTDQAVWMIKHLGFCSQSWDFLVDRCPRPWCGRRLTWSSARMLAQCQHCGALVSEAKRRKVPKQDRPILAWLTQLFSENEEVVAQAVERLPAFFRIDGATDVYELVIGLAGAMRALRLTDPADESPVELTDVAAAARYLVEFPRSQWDVWRLDVDQRSTFRRRLEHLQRHTTVAVVQREFLRILAYGHERIGKNVRSVRRGEFLNTTNAARLLGVEKGDVRRLADAGLLMSLSAGGGSVRTHSVFRWADVHALKGRICQRMSWREFCQTAGLPRLALEQLLARRTIDPFDDDAVVALFGDRQLHRKSVDGFIRRFADLPYSRLTRGWIGLLEVMQGIGGREKPWARLIEAGLCGELPGGFRRGHDASLSSLLVHPVTAHSLLMGGVDGPSQFAFPEQGYGEFYRERLTPSEAATHLNCTAQDISWLRSKALLQAVNAKGASVRYARSEVEALGTLYISTREIAARLGVKSKDVWDRCDLLRSEVTIGQGFHLRDAVESRLFYNRWVSALRQETERRIGA